VPDQIRFYQRAFAFRVQSAESVPEFRMSTDLHAGSAGFVANIAE